MEQQETRQKTREEIDHLKANWLGDPVWDIEETEGFEAHRAELFGFRMQQERFWGERRARENRLAAKRVGLDGNTTMGAYVIALEARLEALEERLNERGV